MARRQRGVKMTPFFDAPEVRLMAQEIITVNHPHLEGKNIRYVFCSKTPPGARGCKTTCAALLMGGLPLSMALGLPEKQTQEERDEKIHVIRVTAPSWHQLDEPKKRAKLDHALAHCGMNDKGSPVLWLHDVEEFRSIVIRHGLLSDEMQKFGEACANAAGQTTLPLDAPFRESAEVLESRRAANGGKHDGVQSRMTEALHEAAAQVNAGALGPNVTATVGRAH